MTHTTGKMSGRARARHGLALAALLAAVWTPASAHLDPPQNHYATWASPTAAVTALWGARLTYNRPWVWGTLAQNLDPTISAAIAKGSGLASAHPPQLTPNSVYLIPKVSIRSVTLPRALHHLAAALLTYPPAHVGAAGFYPGYTDSEGLPDLRNTAYAAVGAYRVFLTTETRSRHDNDTMYLPAVVAPACPAPALAVVVAAWNGGTPVHPAKEAVMDAFNAAVPAPALAGLSNAQKWQCFAMRAAPPGVAVYNAAVGYIEIGHPDQAPREYSDSNNGRVVYDYVNGRVYYTPTHYRPSYMAAGAPVQSVDNFCPAGQTCISPFFEIVQ